MVPLYAGVELGGTKVICGLAYENGNLQERKEIRTLAPQHTLPQIRAILDAFVMDHGQFAALGIGTFGPVRLDRSAPDFGHLGPSPKTLWRNCDLYGFFRQWLAVPIALDTDVSAAAIGEVKWGAAVGCETAVYITVGTGIGGGVIVAGRPVHGLLHPELGHMRVQRAAGDEFSGSCPCHMDCVEGMAAGPAIVQRWGSQLAQLPPGHSAYKLIAHYLAHLVTNVILLVAPQKIVLGGGVMSNRALFPLIRKKVQRLLNGFIAIDQIENRIDDLIVPPGLDADAGVLGAIATAIETGSSKKPT